MPYNPDIPTSLRYEGRRSIRLQGFNYSQAGAYFVTIVTWNREHLFGEIIDGEMKLNGLGLLVKNEWLRLPLRLHNIQLDEFVVMPNHLHGIICILDGVGTDVSVGAWQKMELMSGSPSLATPLPGKTSPLPTPPASGSLGSIVGTFKSTTARLVNGLRRSHGNPIWQRNYYEHVIRSERSYTEISTYITNNPVQWEMDELFI